MTLGEPLSGGSVGTETGARTSELRELSPKAREWVDSLGALADRLARAIVFDPEDLASFVEHILRSPPCIIEATRFPSGPVLVITPNNLRSECHIDDRRTSA